ncbi:type II toxin-antitoxin system RelE/ParE family toxin [Rhizobium binxianense]
MTLKIVFRPKADKDLLDIYEFIAADNPAAALEFVRRLRQFCQGLEQMPEERCGKISLQASAFWFSSGA